MEQPYTRQLVMKLADLEQIPPLVLPEGYQIHTADVHSREVWEAIVESAFDAKIDYTEKLDRPALVPETRCWFVTVNGTDVATASSYNNKDYPGLGFLHMVATRKDARGLGAGRLLSCMDLRAAACMAVFSRQMISGFLPSACICLWALSR